MRYKLFNQNCIEKLLVWPTNIFDLIITSPPYDNMRVYNGFMFDYKPILNELLRVLKPGGIVVWIVNDQTVNGSETGTSFKQALFALEIGFNLHDTMIYCKTSAQPLTHNRYDPCFEYMFIFSKGKPKTFNPILEPTTSKYKLRDRSKEIKSNLEKGSSGRCRDEVTVVKDLVYRKNVWFISPVEKSNNEYKHPAMFPVSLIKDHILSWSNENDIILDPMMGSGTTGVACMLTNRQFVGIEISEKYFNMAQLRIQNALNDKNI